MSPGFQEMYEVYLKTVEKLFRDNPETIYALEADLSHAMGTKDLAQIMGERYVDVGIMEAHMVSMAAGISLSGGFPFVHSFGQFLARRALDQIFVSLAYSDLDACLVGSNAGVCSEHEGGANMSFEDLGLMRTIPKITIYEVSDPVQFSAVLQQAYKNRRLSYIRTPRRQIRVMYEAGTDFASGAVVLRPGSDISIFAAGLCVPQALAAAELLAEQNISAEVIDVFRVKPLNAEVLLKSAKKTGLVVSAENHSVTNGLGSAIAELLAENLPIPMARIGVKEQFGQVGTTRYLLEKYGLTSTDIATKALQLINQHS